MTPPTNPFSPHRGLVLAFLLLFSLARGVCSEDNKDETTAQLPPELRGAKIYRVPEGGEAHAPAESPVVYRRLAYEDINFERLVLKLSVSIKPFDREATIRRIFFQDVRANGIPVQVETFEKEFKVSKKEIVDLPAPLKCTITFSDLESLAPIKEIINQDKITVTGQSFIEVKLSTLQKIALRSKRLALPVSLREEVPLDMFSGNPLLRMAVNGVFDILTDPASVQAIALAKAHLARIAKARRLEQKGSQSLFFLYTEYALRDPKTGASEKFSQSGTGFVVSADGKVATAKRVVEPWKFDAQIAWMIARDHLEVDSKSIRVAAWPAGANLQADDGAPDRGSAFTSEKQTLQVLRMSPDRFEKHEYQDADSDEKGTLDLHAGGESDLALLKLSGESFQPLDLAAGFLLRADSNLSLLGFPFGLSQGQATPKPMEVTVAAQEGGLMLDCSLNPGQSGAPLVTLEGKVVALCAEPNQCVPVESLRELIP